MAKDSWRRHPAASASSLPSIGTRRSAPTMRCGNRTMGNLVEFDIRCPVVMTCPGTVYVVMTDEDPISTWFMNSVAALGARGTRPSFRSLLKLVALCLSKVARRLFAKGSSSLVVTISFCFAEFHSPEHAATAINAVRG
ncbi:UNVERIFIED_CONTAM: hypothetical protein Slati_1156200 [Sesamum latifolium]|uniref:Uncharacterized protein n=1 Tax=Sesamum latifolium TaxID=2727402 RepID=A0AAW2XHT2_9LAMI